MELTSTPSDTRAGGEQQIPLERSAKKAASSDENYTAEQEDEENIHYRR